MPMPKKIHEYLRRARHGGVKITHAPQGTHKEYPRMPRVTLPPHIPLSMPLTEALSKRSSNDASTRTIDIGLISTLLWNSARVREDGKRPHPSAGALYPIETYLITHATMDAPRGCFHYHPTGHALEHLWDVPEKFNARALAPTAEKSAAFIIFVGVWERTSLKYGDFGYLHAVLETGHIAQNVLLTATALHVSARPVAGFDDEMIIAALDLDTDTELPVYVVALGF